MTFPECQTFPKCQIIQTFPKCHLRELLLQLVVVPADLLVLSLLLLGPPLVLLPLPGVVGVLADEDQLGHEHQGHGQEAAEDVGQGDEDEGGVLLIT